MLKRLVLPLALLTALPLTAQQSRTFSYGSGMSSPMGESGLHIAASAEFHGAPGGVRRRVELSVHDRAARDVFLLGSLLFPLRSIAFGSPYLLAGAGFYTGDEIPIAANLGAGLESTRLSPLPLFLEARLLYGGAMYVDGITSFGVHRAELVPTVTLGMKFPLRP